MKLRILAADLGGSKGDFIWRIKDGLVLSTNNSSLSIHEGNGSYCTIGIMGGALGHNVKL